MFEKVLEIGTGILIFYQGKIALTACSEKTQDLVWELIKRSGLIVGAHLLLYIIQTITTYAIVIDVVHEWENQTMKEGTYTFSRGDNALTFDRSHSGPHQPEM